MRTKQDRSDKNAEGTDPGAPQCRINCKPFSVTTGTVSIQGIERIEARATVSFDLTVKSGFTSIANQAFPMEAGETVTIKAAYTPMDASVDVGLVDSDGAFHYFNVKNGSIDKTIRIETRGNYKLAIRNNSGNVISVSGYVKY